MGFEQGFGWRASPNWFTNMLQLVKIEGLDPGGCHESLVQGLDPGGCPLHNLEVLQLFDPFWNLELELYSSISYSSISVDRRYDDSILSIYPSDPLGKRGH